MTNGIYYPRRATRLMRPGMTREQYMHGYDETDKLVNTVIGMNNEVARLALADAIYAVEKSEYYRHEIKKWTKETFKEQEAYEGRHLSKFFKDQQQVFLDYLDAVEKEFKPHIFNMYMSLKMAMMKAHQHEAGLKAKVECGRVIAMIACANFDVLMREHKKKYGADYTAVFEEYRYTKPLALWSKVTERIVVDNHPENPTSLTDDAMCKRSYEVLACKMCDYKIINRIGCVAISQNKETAKKYANEEELKELFNSYG